jgi:hypothetical protein
MAIRQSQGYYSHSSSFFSPILAFVSCTSDIFQIRHRTSDNISYMATTALNVKPLTIAGQYRRTRTFADATSSNATSDSNRTSTHIPYSSKHQQRT